MKEEEEEKEDKLKKIKEGFKLDMIEIREHE